MPGTKTQPVKIVTGSATQVVANVAGQSLSATEVNVFAETTNSGTVYVGDANVTTANGWPLAPGAGMSLPCTGTNEIFCIGPGGGEKLRVLSLSRY